MSKAVLSVSVRRWARYPEYRPFAALSLRELPAHWRATRLKYVAGINQDVLDDSTDPDFEFRYVDIGNVDSLGRVIGEEPQRFETAPSRARRCVRRGDVIISTVRTYLRAIALIEDDAERLIVSTGFAVLRANRDVEPRFLWRLVQSSEFVDMVVAHSEGVSYPAINPTELAGLPFWLPPASEQRAIAAFLDRETARIDELIAKKERMIALLEEKRLALISCAVTGRLEPRRACSNTGLPWLSRLPNTWSRVAIGWVARVRNGSTPSRSREDYWEDGEVAWVSSGEVNQRIVLTPTDYIARAAVHQDNLRVVQKGAVLVGMIGQGRTRGTCSILGIDACINQNVAAIEPGPQLDSEYLYYVLTHSYDPLRNYGRGGQQAALNCELIQSFRIPLPPLEEQLQIARQLNAQTAQLDHSATRLAEHVSLLHEYRAALISAAVTGRIDVRHEAQP